MCYRGWIALTVSLDLSWAVKLAGIFSSTSAAQRQRQVMDIPARAREDSWCLPARRALTQPGLLPTTIATQTQILIVSTEIFLVAKSTNAS